MTSQIKGPALFLAQFAGDEPPFNSLESIIKWAASLGYKGIQIPTFDTRLFNLDLAAESEAYCDEVTGICKDAGIAIRIFLHTFKDSWLQLTPPMILYLMHLRLITVKKIHKNVRHGQSIK